MHVHNWHIIRTYTECINQKKRVAVRTVVSLSLLVSAYGVHALRFTFTARRSSCFFYVIPNLAMASSSVIAEGEAGSNDRSASR